LRRESAGETGDSALSFDIKEYDIPTYSDLLSVIRDRRIYLLTLSGVAKHTLLELWIAAVANDLSIHEYLQAYFDRFQIMHKLKCADNSIVSNVLDTFSDVELLVKRFVLNSNNNENLAITSVTEGKLKNIVPEAIIASKSVCSEQVSELTKPCVAPSLPKDQREPVITFDGITYNVLVDSRVSNAHLGMPNQVWKSLPLSQRADLVIDKYRRMKNTLSLTPDSPDGKIWTAWGLPSLGVHGMSHFSYSS